MKRLLLGMLLASLALTAQAGECILRQSTASQSLLLGPFVDSTDGSTAETALSIANTDILLSANGGTLTAKNSGGATHDASGFYTTTLDATDTATVGRLQAEVTVSGALPVWLNCVVVEEAVYDNVFAASAVGPLTAAAVNSEVDTGLSDFGPATAAKLLAYVQLLARKDSAIETDNSTELSEINADEGSGGGGYSAQTDSHEGTRDRGDAAWTTGSGTGLTAVASGTAQSATGTTLVLASGETFADDELIGAVVQITGGSAGVGQSRCITDYAGSSDTATVANWTTTPTGTITYEVAPSLGGECPLSTSSGATALNVTASGNIGIDLANVENPTTTLNLSGTTIGTVTTNTDMRGTDSAATAASLATAQADLDTLTGSDGATLATTQGNYAPATAASVAALNDVSVADVVAGILAGQIEDQGAGYDLQCTLATLLAYAAGEVSTTTGTSTYQDPGGNTDRIVGTVSGSSRTSITITCP